MNKYLLEKNRDSQLKEITNIQFYVFYLFIFVKGDIVSHVRQIKQTLPFKIFDVKKKKIWQAAKSYDNVLKKL